MPDPSAVSSSSTSSTTDPSSSSSSSSAAAAVAASSSTRTTRARSDSLNRNAAASSLATMAMVASSAEWLSPDPCGNRTTPEQEPPVSSRNHHQDNPQELKKGTDQVKVLTLSSSQSSSSTVEQDSQTKTTKNHRDKDHKDDENEEQVDDDEYYARFVKGLAMPSSYTTANNKEVPHHLPPFNQIMTTSATSAVAATAAAAAVSTTATTTAQSIGDIMITKKPVTGGIFPILLTSRRMPVTTTTTTTATKPILTTTTTSSSTTTTDVSVPSPSTTIQSTSTMAPTTSSTATTTALAMMMMVDTKQPISTPTTSNTATMIQTTPTNPLSMPMAQPEEHSGSSSSSLSHVTQPQQQHRAITDTDRLSKDDKVTKEYDDDDDDDDDDEFILEEDMLDELEDNDDDNNHSININNNNINEPKTIQENDILDTTSTTTKGTFHGKEVPQNISTNNLANPNTTNSQESVVVVSTPTTTTGDATLNSSISSPKLTHRRTSFDNQDHDDKDDNDNGEFDDDDDDDWLPEFWDSEFYQDLEDELGSLLEEDLEAAVATLLNHHASSSSSSTTATTTATITAGPGSTTTTSNFRNSAFQLTNTAADDVAAAAATMMMVKSTTNNNNENNQHHAMTTTSRMAETKRTAALSSSTPSSTVLTTKGSKSSTVAPTALPTVTTTGATTKSIPSSMKSTMAKTTTTMTTCNTSAGPKPRNTPMSTTSTNQNLHPMTTTTTTSSTTTPSGSTVGAAAAPPTVAQQQHLQRLMEQHYQLLLQQAVLAIRTAHYQKNYRHHHHQITQSQQQQHNMNSTNGGTPDWIPPGSESADDLAEILDGAVGMLQDLDENRKDAIRTFLQLESAQKPGTASPSSSNTMILIHHPLHGRRSLLPQLLTAASEKDTKGKPLQEGTDPHENDDDETNDTSNTNKTNRNEGTAKAGERVNHPRRLTRAAFKSTLQQPQPTTLRKSNFDIMALSKLPETFALLDKCVDGSVPDPLNILRATSNADACRLLFKYLGGILSPVASVNVTGTAAGGPIKISPNEKSKFHEAWIPGVRDLSEHFSDPKENFGVDFSPPLTIEQQREARKNRNLFTSGEDNLVLRGVNLYGEKQWLLIADRYLPDRSVNIISQRYSMLCLMLYRAHGISIDRNGNLDAPPKLESVDDIDEEKVAKLKQVEPPAILNVHRWSLEEDLTLLKAVPIMGHMWAELGARLIPHRDRGHLRKRYQVLERRVKATIARVGKKAAANNTVSGGTAAIATTSNINTSDAKKQLSTTTPITVKSSASVPTVKTTATNALVNTKGVLNSKAAPITSKSIGATKKSVPASKAKSPPKSAPNISFLKRQSPVKLVSPRNMRRLPSNNGSRHRDDEDEVRGKSFLPLLTSSPASQSSRYAFESLVNETSADWSQMSRVKELMENDKSLMTGAVNKHEAKAAVTTSLCTSHLEQEVTNTLSRLPQMELDGSSSILSLLRSPDASSSVKHNIAAKTVVDLEEDSNKSKSHLSHFAQGEDDKKCSGGILASVLERSKKAPSKEVVDNGTNALAKEEDSPLSTTEQNDVLNTAENPATPSRLPFIYSDDGTPIGLSPTFRPGFSPHFYGSNSKIRLLSPSSRVCFSPDEQNSMLGHPIQDSNSYYAAVGGGNNNNNNNEDSVDGIEFCHFLADHSRINNNTNTPTTKVLRSALSYSTPSKIGTNLFGEGLMENDDLVAISALNSLCNSPAILPPRSSSKNNDCHDDKREASVATNPNRAKRKHDDGQTSFFSKVVGGVQEKKENQRKQRRLEF